MSKIRPGLTAAILCTMMIIPGKLVADAVVGQTFIGQPVIVTNLPLDNGRVIVEGQVFAGKLVQAYSTQQLCQSFDPDTPQLPDLGHYADWEVKSAVTIVLHTGKVEECLILQRPN